MTEKVTQLPDPLLPLERFMGKVDAHPTTLQRWVKTGKLRGYKLGGKWYVRMSDWEAFVDAGQVAS